LESPGDSRASPDHVRIRNPGAEVATPAVGSDRPQRVLVIWPPQVPSYFNAGHRLAVFQVSAYLRHHRGADVVAVDAAALNVNWKECGDLLFQGEFDVIALANDFDAIDGFDRFIHYARELCPQARLVTFGRLSGMHPAVFERFDLDGIVASGDYESGVAAFLDLVTAGPSLLGPGQGLAVRDGARWIHDTRKGARLDPDDWCLPDVTEIPYHAYDALYANDAHRFCGIPNRRELVVPVARGCPVGCSFCEVPDLFGKRERRLPVHRVVDYIEHAFAVEPFEYVAFYAPTFTLDPAWVRALCSALRTSSSQPRWKCATTVHHLTEELVHDMGAAGCVRISVGLETLAETGHGSLPRIKRLETKQFTDLVQWCDAAGVELNAFVIVGLPGTAIEAARHTIELVEQLGVRVRPTMYTPYHEMSAELSNLELSSYNRHLIHPGADVSARALHYREIFGANDRLTAVFERVPSRT